MYIFTVISIRVPTVQDMIAVSPFSTVTSVRLELLAAGSVVIVLGSSFFIFLLQFSRGAGKYFYFKSIVKNFERTSILRRINNKYLPLILRKLQKRSFFQRKIMSAELSSLPSVHLLGNVKHVLTPFPSLLRLRTTQHMGTILVTRQRFLSR